MITISELYYYPIKSCQAVRTSNLVIDDRGPNYDRRWMIVDPEGKFITQRQTPILSQFSVSIKAGGTHSIVITAPNGQTIEVSVPEGDQCEKKMVTVWKDQCAALVAPKEVCEWLSIQLNVTCELVYMPQDSIRYVDSNYNLNQSIVSFSDGFPFLLISQASLETLNKQSQVTLESLRFRPNIVISGAKAFEEDTWRKVKVGSVVFDVVKPCSRCVIPSINLNTGEKQREVLLTLKEQRFLGGAIYFGQNLIHQQQGEISEGDEVVVIEQSDVSNIPGI